MYHDKLTSTPASSSQTSSRHSRRTATYLSGSCSRPAPPASSPASPRSSLASPPWRACPTSTGYTATRTSGGSRGRGGMPSCISSCDGKMSRISSITPHLSRMNRYNHPRLENPFPSFRCHFLLAYPPSCTPPPWRGVV